MRTVCGEDNFISPAVRVLRDDDASFVLFTAWSKDLKSPLQLAQETGLPKSVVNKCLRILEANCFIVQMDDLFEVNDLGELLLATLGFEKQEVLVEEGWTACLNIDAEIEEPDVSDYFIISHKTFTSEPASNSLVASAFVRENLYTEIEKTDASAYSTYFSSQVKDSFNELDPTFKLAA